VFLLSLGLGSISMPQESNNKTKKGRNRIRGNTLFIFILNISYIAWIFLIVNIKYFDIVLLCFLFRFRGKF